MLRPPLLRLARIRNCRISANTFFLSTHPKIRAVFQANPTGHLAKFDDALVESRSGRAVISFIYCGIICVRARLSHIYYFSKTKFFKVSSHLYACPYSPKAGYLYIPL